MMRIERMNVSSDDGGKGLEALLKRLLWCTDRRSGPESFCVPDAREYRKTDKHT